jgi:hypothetical protein
MCSLYSVSDVECVPKPQTDSGDAMQQAVVRMCSLYSVSDVECVPKP